MSHIHASIWTSTQAALNCSHRLTRASIASHREAFMRHCAGSIVVCVVFFLMSTSSEAQRGTTGGQWPNHSGDKGSTKYAPLDQINKNNVRNLHIAWRRPAVASELRV